MRDMRGDACGFLCLAEGATLHCRGHVASSALSWAAEDGGQVKLPSAVFVTDSEIGSEMRLSYAVTVAGCEIGSL